MKSPIFYIIKDTLIYGIGNVLAKGMSFLMAIVYTHFIITKDMGAYGYVSVIMALLFSIIEMGSGNAFARYYFEYKDETSKKTLTSSILLFYLFICLVVITPLVVMHERLANKMFDTAQYNNLLLLAILSQPILLFSSFFDQIFRNQFKATIFIIFSNIRTILTITIAFLLLIYTGLGVLSLVLANLAALLLPLPIKIYTLRNSWSYTIDLGMLKKIVKYGIPFIPTGIAYWIFSSIDRVMLEEMSSLEEVGVYTIAAGLSGIVSLFTTAIGQAWAPRAIDLYEKNPEAAKDVYSRFFSILIFGVGSVVFISGLFAKELIVTFLHSSYHQAFIPALILIIGLSFQATTQVISIGIYLRKKTIYFFYISLLTAIFNIAMNYLLIPLFHGKGAAIATCLSYVLLTVLLFVTSQLLYRTKYNWKSVAAFLTFVLIALVVPDLPLVSKMAIFVIYLLILYYLDKKTLNVLQDIKNRIRLM
jgi:O-antigen/teichoic acid export membrane protein